MKPVQVKCYSGRVYAERPISFILDDIPHTVRSVEKEWRGPGAKHFLVITSENRHIELCYNEQNHEWSASDPGGKEPG